MSHLYDKNCLYQKATNYCKLHSNSVVRELGHGTQGIVYQTSNRTAIKVYDQEIGYKRERNVYTRLKERNIFKIKNSIIPRILNFDDFLLIIEMSIVHVPCVLDFGGAYLDNNPEHVNRDVEWFEVKREEFGKNWEEAQEIVRELEYRADIILGDVNIGNIKFDDD